MTNYYVATTYSKGHKYSCCFSEASDADKWLNVVASYDNYHRPLGSMYEFHEELRRNFNLKYFEKEEDTFKYRDIFLGLK